MGYEDAVTKDYIADADVFADAFNYFLYGGEQVIRPEKLHEIDPALIQAPYGADGKEETVQRYRDVLKYVEAREDGRAAYLLLGIENQSEIHYAMPVKVMGYDALQYAKQVDAVAKTHRSRRDWKKRGSGEFLSGFYREDRLVPVITLVIFFSDRKWDGPLCLKEMFEQDENLPMEYVQDYRIHLITPESLAEEELKKFHSSLREVMAFLKYSRNKQKMDELITDNRRFSRIDRKAWNVLDKCTKLNLNLPEEREEESVNMCQAWDDMKKEIEEKTEQRMCQAWEDMKKEVEEKTEQRMQKEWEQKEKEVEKKTEQRMCQAWEDMKKEVEKKTEQRMCQAWEDMKKEVEEKTEQRIQKDWEQKKKEVEEKTEQRMCQAWEDMKKEVEEKTEQRIQKEWEQKKKDVEEKTEQRIRKEWEQKKKEVEKETKQRIQKEWSQKRDEMIIHAINMLRALNQSEETALTQLTLQFALPRQTAEEYLRRFWR